MGTYVAGDAPDMDRLVAEAVRGVGAEIDSLRVPRLAGVVLGGGYGRGEGGCRLSDGERRLSNDLDFFAVTEDGASGADIAAVSAALAPVAERWTGRLGIDVDFAVRTPWRLRHDQERVMIQELLHGYFDVAGTKGAEMFRGIDLRPPSAFPWTESVRLLVNRGVGLMLAREQGASGDFVARNVNKCVLGAGDARLIARGGYLWKAAERAEAIGEPLYSAAVEWKFRPKRDAVCGWDEAQAEWLKAAEEVMAAGRRTGAMRRTAYQAARWIWRRRTLGNPATLGYGAVVRILLELEPTVRGRGALARSLRRDWEIFN
ncbi:MAG: hypothetical protein IKE55_01950 [Kiritimatiellae bacterium]|nr:hypothetical protein [Kiritimatiellia bacterium]